MQVYTPVPDHADHRGDIFDFATENIDAVTIVRTKAGAVRGNHYHAETSQWAYIAAGRLVVTDGADQREVGPGEIVYDPPGSPHAWRALEDTVCVVVVRGPRAGRDYESDTYRLDEPLIVA